MRIMCAKKHRRQARPAPVVEEQATSAPWAYIAIGVVIVAGAGWYMASGSSDITPSPDATVPTTQAAATPATATEPDLSPAGEPGALASTVSETPVTFEGSNDLPIPPLPYGAQTAGPPEQVRQAYIFAARNPGVLEYVPCYCGCGETDGHTSNVDCFVASRASNGAVESWDTHGMT